MRAAIQAASDTFSLIRESPLASRFVWESPILPGVCLGREPRFLGVRNLFMDRPGERSQITRSPGRIWKLFRLMGPEQQTVLFSNTARALGDAPDEVKIRHIDNCLKADPAYGKGIAAALKISLKEVEASKNA